MNSSGILKPQRDSNGYRMYSINDIRTLNILRELRSIGFFHEPDQRTSEVDFDLNKTVDPFKEAISAIDKKTEEMNVESAALNG